MKCGVIGASGYSGTELIQLLLKHPAAQQVQFISRKPDAEFRDTISGGELLDLRSLDDFLARPEVDVLFLATPHGVSMDLVPKLYGSVPLIIDLSGAYRLPQDQFESAYSMKHESPEFIDQALYGIVPLIEGNKYRQAKLISNPGCYATACELPLTALLASGCVDESRIVIDAKSGVSGAGKKESFGFSFSELHDEFLPYKTGKHQHFPEIQFHVKKATGKQVNGHFSTSLLPLFRGIQVAIYGTYQGSKDVIMKSFETYFGNYALMHFSDSGKKEFQSLRRVQNTPECMVSLHFPEEAEKKNSDEWKNFYCFSSIDNLLKGAASQAIENMNLALGLYPETGLLPGGSQ
jgi:N-acetyl-gamma-glutamyl-phosphate reductase